MVIEIPLEEKEGSAKSARGGAKSALGSAKSARGVVQKTAQELNPLLTNPNELKNINIPDEGKTLEQEANTVAEMFSSINKDWRSFFIPGPQRTSIKKLIKFAQEDGLEITDLIQMAKEAQGVEYAPQVFTPSDMVAKYSKLIANSKKITKNTLPVLPIGTTYTPGKYAPTNPLEITNVNDNQ